MVSNWTEWTLGDLFEQSNQGVNTTTEKVEYTEDGVAVIRAKNITAYSIDYQDIVYVSKETFNRVKNTVKPQYGDILFTNIGSQMGNASLVRTNKDFIIAWNVFRICPNLDRVDAKYLESLLNNEETRNLIHGLNASSTMPFVSGKVLKSIKIKLPPLLEQRAIAHILSSLDEKIELNRQMNETLEAMAQALFKSWFVDFDPVIDNALLAGNDIPDELAERAELRQAQLNSGKAKTNSEINDLFPSEFEFTEDLGWIPKGWSDGNLSDFSFVKGGYAFKSKDFTNEGLPVIKIKNINDDRTVNVYDVQYIPEGIAKNSKEFFLETGDLIMAMTGATVGKFGLLVAENAQSYLLNQRVAKFTSSIDQVSKVWFIYCFLNQKSTINHIVNIAEGSAQPNISATSIMATPSIVPTIEIINRFGNLVDGYFSKMIVNRQEIYTLAKLRDTLLPKLMSGELRIPDAEKLAENI